MGNRLKKWQIRIFVISWLTYASIYLGRVNLSVALPEIQIFFDYSKAEVGFIGSAFFWTYAVGHVINGRIGDKISTRHLIFVGLLVVGLSNGLFGYAKNYQMMILLWMVNAYAQSTLWGPMVRALALWFESEKQHAVAIAISTSMVGGNLITLGLTGYIIVNHGWRFAFYVPSVMIISMAFLWLIVFRNEPNDLDFGFPSEKKEVSSNKLNDEDGEGYWSVLKASKLGYLIIACFAHGIVKDSIVLWAPSLFMETQNLSIIEATRMIMFLPFMSFFGMYAAARLNKVFKNQVKLTISVLFGIGVLTLIGFAGLGHINTFVALGFLGLTSAAQFGINTLLLGVIPMGYAKYNRASTIAGLFQGCVYFAAGITAFLTGAVVDEVGWEGVIIFWGITSFLGMIILFRSWQQDRRNLCVFV